MDIHDQIIDQAARKHSAELAALEAEARAYLTAKVSDAIWASLKSQSEEERFGPWVDRSKGVIDGHVDMDAAAAAAVDVFLEFLRNPPVREVQSDGTETVRWP